MFPGFRGAHLPIPRSNPSDFPSDPAPDPFDTADFEVPHVFPLRNTEEVYEKTFFESKRLLHGNGLARDGCKQQVSRHGIHTWYITLIFHSEE